MVCEPVEFLCGPHPSIVAALVLPNGSPSLSHVQQIGLARRTSANGGVFALGRKGRRQAVGGGESWVC